MRSLLSSSFTLFRLLSLRRAVSPIILTLDLLDNLLHLIDLLLPRRRAHLLLLLEQVIIGLPVAAAEAIPQGGELTVVVVEGEVVNRMAGGAVNNGVVGVVLAVVDHDGPEVDEHKEADVRHLLEREDEGEHVVGNTLGETVDGVEGVAGVGSGHDPLVVRLVQVLVHERVVEAAVNPVDAKIGEHDEERELEEVVPAAGALIGGVV